MLKTGVIIPWNPSLKLIADQLDSERRLKEEEAFGFGSRKKKAQQEQQRLIVSGKTEAEIEAIVFVKCGFREK